MTNPAMARLGSALGVLLILLFAGATLAHDFGGNTAPGTPEPDPKKPDCNQCPCSGPDDNGGGPGNPTPPPPSTTEKPISLYDGAKELNVTDLVVNGCRGHDKVEALMALGSFGRDTDIERLKAIAIGGDELLATGALSGLIMSRKRAAISEVERISTDATLPEQRRKLARQLLGMPRSSPLR